jgi:hypothetical protein
MGPFQIVWHFLPLAVPLIAGFLLNDTPSVFSGWAVVLLGAIGIFVDWSLLRINLRIDKMYAHAPNGVVGGVGLMGMLFWRSIAMSSIVVGAYAFRSCEAIVQYLAIGAVGGFWVCVGIVTEHRMTRSFCGRCAPEDDRASP